MKTSGVSSPGRRNTHFWDMVLMIPVVDGYRVRQII